MHAINGGCELVPCDGVDNHVGQPCLASIDVVGTLLLMFGCSCVGQDDGIGRWCSCWCTVAL